MEPEGSLKCWEASVIGPHLELGESSPDLRTIFL